MAIETNFSPKCFELSPFAWHCNPQGKASNLNSSICNIMKEVCYPTCSHWLDLDMQELADSLSEFLLSGGYIPSEPKLTHLLVHNSRFKTEMLANCSNLKQLHIFTPPKKLRVIAVL